MSSIGDGFKNVIMMGIGVMSYTADKGKEIIDQLVERGELSFEQGLELNEELKRKADETATSLREGTLEACMKAMKPEEREAFAAKAAEFAKAQNEADATKAQEETVEAEVIEEEVVVEAEEAAEEAADAVEEAATEAADQAAEAAGDADEATKA
ncbi:MAG TPA: hypothetical protein DCP91_12260 [Eggerthellaceae bacterium]|nr:hypothetical protein [Eggerthellaceae bacterium]